MVVKWRKVYNWELCNFTHLQILLKLSVKEGGMEMACSINWEKRSAHRILDGKLEGVRTLRRTVIMQRIIIKWILEILRAVIWTECICLGIEISEMLL
jgi:hypothetical protein